MLPYFKRAEDNENGTDAYHGTGGPLAVSNRRTLHPLSEAYLQSCIAVGMPHMADVNDAAAGRCRLRARDPAPGGGAGARPALTCGRRWGGRNLRVLTHTHVRRVLFDGRRATGVEYTRRGRTERAEAGARGDSLRRHIRVAASC